MELLIAWMCISKRHGEIFFFLVILSFLAPQNHLTALFIIQKDE